MDPVSVTVGALGVIGSMTKVFETVKAAFDPSREVPGPLVKIMARLEIIEAIFAESVLMIRELSGRPRASAVAAVKRCTELLEELNDFLTKYLKVIISPAKAFRRTFSGNGLLETFEPFKSAVLLLQSIATDPLTHDLLRSVHRDLAAKQEHYYDFTGDLNILSHDSISADRTTSENTSSSTGPRQASHNHSNPLETRALRPQEIKDSGLAGTPSTSDFYRDIACPACKGPWHHEHERPDARVALSLFNATISYIIDEDSRSQNPNLGSTDESNTTGSIQKRGIWFAVRGKYDTGADADADFIAEDVIRRAKLQQYVVKIQTPAQVKALGATFDFDKVIILNWTMNHDLSSQTREFYVARDDVAPDFDILLGDVYLKEHDYVQLSKNKSMSIKPFSFQAMDQDALEIAGHP